jgi:prevent-host-death family protein
MSIITLEEAQAQLSTLISNLKPGEEIQITKNNQPVARLVGESNAVRQPRKPGSAIGKIKIISEDNEHLEDFKEYMP